MLMTVPLMPCGLEWSGFGARLGRGVWPLKADTMQAVGEASAQKKTASEEAAWV